MQPCQCVDENLTAIGSVQCTKRCSTFWYIHPKILPGFPPGSVLLSPPRCQILTSVLPCDFNHLLIRSLPVFYFPATLWAHLIPILNNQTSYLRPALPILLGPIVTSGLWMFLNGFEKQRLHFFFFFFFNHVCSDRCWFSPLPVLDLVACQSS